jgi:hypothetical protein
MGHDFSGPIPIGHTLSFPDKNPFSFCKWLSNGLGIGLARNGKRIRGDGGPPNTIRLGTACRIQIRTASAPSSQRSPPPAVQPQTSNETRRSALQLTARALKSPAADADRRLVLLRSAGSRRAARSPVPPVGGRVCRHAMRLPRRWLPRQRGHCPAQRPVHQVRHLCEYAP